MIVIEANKLIKEIANIHIESVSSELNNNFTSSSYIIYMIEKALYEFKVKLINAIEKSSVEFEVTFK